MTEESPEGVYKTFLAEIERRQLSNAESLDKAVLSLSSAGLGFSIILLKDFPNAQTSGIESAIYGTWIFFVVAILATVVSYFTSQKGLDRQKTIAKEILIGGKKHQDSSKNRWIFWTTFLSYGAAVLFSVAIICTTGIVMKLRTGDTAMSQSTTETPADPPLDLPTKGAPIPTIPTINPPASPSTPPNQPGSPATPPNPEPAPSNKPVESDA